MNGFINKIKKMAIITAIGIAIMYFMNVASTTHPDYTWVFSLMYWIVGIYIAGQLLKIDKETS
jgi:uncharacterized membrane protein YdbT with pleckstrin-like domain